jgi:uncharacterized membrane protein YqjE
MLEPEPGLPRPADDTPPAPAPEAVAAAHEPSGFTALKDDVTALVEDARTYAVAEIAFQKVRAGLAGKSAARAALWLVLALVLLNLALIALAVGVVIALAPLVTIWGAIAIVVGVLLAAVAVLVIRAAAEGRSIAAMFADEGEA